MARISIDPTKIKTAPKFRSVRIKFNWPPHHFLGFLCAFWGTVADNNETGEISDWTPDYLAEIVGLGNVDPNELWGVLVECGYIEQRSDGRVFVQDWLEMTEPYLRKKYHNSDPQRLVNIWALYGRIYGREPKTQKTEVIIKEIDPDGPDFLKESSPFPKGSKKEMAPPDIYKEPPKDLRGGEESFLASSWETEESKKETSRDVLVEKSAVDDRRDPKARPEVHLLLERFRDRLSTLGDEPASFAFGVWGKYLKQLLKDGFGPQEIDRRFDNWCTSTDRWIKKKVNNGGEFYNHFRELKDGPITANQDGAHGRKPFYDGEGNSPSYKYQEPTESIP